MGSLSHAWKTLLKNLSLSHALTAFSSETDL